MPENHWQYTFDHEGAEIGLTLEGLFEVLIDEDGGVDSFRTLNEAKSRTHELALLARSQINLDLPVFIVVQGKIKEVRIRRIHGGTGNWLCDDQEVGQLYGRCYWPSPATRDLIESLEALDVSRRALADTLNDRAIDLPSVHYFRAEDRNEKAGVAHRRFVDMWSSRSQDSTHVVIPGVDKGFCRCGLEWAATIHNEPDVTTGTQHPHEHSDLYPAHGHTSREAWLQEHDRVDDHEDHPDDEQVSHPAFAVTP